MTLTNTPFNGSNFHRWNRNVRMELGAKLKLGFIDGSCPRPGIQDADLQRWIRCDYMVTCWILNSIVTELSNAFLYAQSACGLWKEIAERCGQSNGPLIYQLERELSKITQDSNSKLIQFVMKLNDDYESVRSQILAMDSLLTVNKAYYIVQQIEKQKQVTNHSFELTAFFANLNNKGANSGRKDNRGSRHDGKNDGKSLCHCLLTLSFSSEIFKSLSFRLDCLCHLAILCLDQHAHTLHHLESLLTISLDRLDIFEGRSCILEFVRKSLSLILELS
ncbi:hypothetical protein Tco_1077769 [Tanacetum coccineum]